MLLSIFRHSVGGPHASVEIPTRYGGKINKNLAYGLVEHREQKGDTFREHTSGSGGEVGNEYEDIVFSAQPLTAGRGERNVLSANPTKRVAATTIEPMEAIYEDIR